MILCTTQEISKSRIDEFGPLGMLEAITNNSPTDAVRLLVDGTHRFTVVNSAYLARALLEQSADTVVKKSDPNSVMDRVFGSGILTASGDEWRTQRHECISELGRLHTRGPEWMLVEDAALELLDAEMATGSTSDIFSSFKRILFEVFLGEVLQSTALVSSARFTELVDLLLDAAREPELLMLENRKNSAAAGEVHSAISELGSITDSIIAHGREAAVWLRRIAELPSEVQRQRIVTMILSGHETTALTLTWLVLQMADRKDQDRLRDEAFARAAVAETLRLAPPVYVLARRVGPAGFSFDGFETEPGERILISIWTINRRGDVYRSPLEFLPERWIGAVSEDERLLTFGAGSRRCLAESCASVLARVMAQRLGERSTFRRANSVAIRPVGFLTVRPSAPVPIDFCNKAAA